MFKIALSLLALILQIHLGEPSDMDSIPLTAPEREIEFVYENNKVIINFDYIEFIGLFVTYCSLPEYKDLFIDVVKRDGRLSIRGLDVPELNAKGELIALPGDPNDIMINDLAHRNYRRKDGYFLWQSKKSFQERLDAILAAFLKDGKAKIYDKVTGKYVNWISNRPIHDQTSTHGFLGFFLPNNELFFLRFNTWIPDEDCDD